MTGLADVVDAALELPVAPSFTSVGPAVRRRTDHWRPLDDYRVDGRTAVVTGATSGLGLAAARQLLRCGARVVVVGRDATRTAGVRSRLADEVPGAAVDAVVADLGDLEEVAAAAAEVEELLGHVDVLLHNAGSLTAARHESPQGIEMTVAAQVVGPFLLTSLLLGALDGRRSAQPGRVLTMTSGGMYAAPLEVDRLQMTPDRYDGTRQYALAKRAQVVLNEMWAARTDPASTVFHAVHPGWADTPGVESSLPLFHKVVGPLLRSPEAGADTAVWLAVDDGGPRTSTGGLWLDRRRRRTHRLARTRRSDTPARRDALWSEVARLAGREG